MADWWRRGQLGGVWDHELLSLPAAAPICLDRDTPGLGSRRKRSEQQRSPLSPAARVAGRSAPFCAVPAVRGSPIH